MDYNDFNLLNKPLVIPGLSSSTAEIDNWVKQTQFDNLTDGEGQRWDVKYHTESIPDETNPKRLKHILKVWASCTMNETAFLKQGVLVLPGDSRLLNLLGSGAVYMQTKTWQQVSFSQESTKQNFRIMYMELQEKISDRPLAGVKRKFLASWIDDALFFGGQQLTETE